VQQFKGNGAREHVYGVPTVCHDRSALLQSCTHWSALQSGWDVRSTRTDSLMTGSCSRRSGKQWHCTNAGAMPEVISYAYRIYCFASLYISWRFTVDTRPVITCIATLCFSWISFVDVFISLCCIFYRDNCIFKKESVPLCCEHIT